MDELKIGDIRNFDGYGVGVVCEVGYLKYLVINEIGNENYIPKETPYKSVWLRPEIREQFGKVCESYKSNKMIDSQIENLTKRKKEIYCNYISNLEKLNKLNNTVEDKEFIEIFKNNLSSEIFELLCNKFHYVIKLDSSENGNSYILSIRKIFKLASNKELNNGCLYNNFVYRRNFNGFRVGKYDIDKENPAYHSVYYSNYCSNSLEVNFKNVMFRTRMSEKSDIEMNGNDTALLFKSIYNIKLGYEEITKEMAIKLAKNIIVRER